MNTQTIVTAASIVSPVGGDFFQGTLAEATSAMVAYAAEMRADYGGGATSDLIKRLRNSDSDRVAEIAAGALLDLAEARAEVDRMRAAFDVIRALHTDSPAGSCPSCYRANDVSDTDDGLVAWPCPTLRAMGTVDGPR